MTDLRRLARDRMCQIRLPHICNGDPARTVGAHFRLTGISGMSIKPPDILIAWSCDACHARVDTDKSAETQLAFAHGVMRTINTLWTEGVLRT